MIFFDTESVGFYGATVLIQWAEDDGDVNVHNIWTRPIKDTLELIEKIVDSDVVGFNLVHDWFHLTKTYNILKQLPSGSPKLLDYHDIEESDSSKLICLKPKSALDLMLYGRKNEFQATMSRADIVIKKVPLMAANNLARILGNVIDVPPIYFSRGDIGYKWRINPIDDEWADIVLKFNPSTALKAIIENVLPPSDEVHVVTHKELRNAIDQVTPSRFKKINFKVFDAGFEMGTQ